MVKYLISFNNLNFNSLLYFFIRFIYNLGEME